jgi:hypothetical protein
MSATFVVAAAAASVWVLGVSRRSRLSRPARNARERFADMLEVLCNKGRGVVGSGFKVRELVGSIHRVPEPGGAVCSRVFAPISWQDRP